MEEQNKKQGANLGGKRTPEEIAGILDVVGDKIPHLLKSMRDLVYSPEAGKEMGQAVGNFYKELIDGGLDPALAAELTRDYLKTLQNLGKGINVQSEK